MKIFIELRHPAHVHQFKYYIREMIKRGHQIKVVAIDKEITTQLLQNLEIDYTLLGANRKELYKKITGVFTTGKKVYKLAKDFGPDIFVGRCISSSAHISVLLHKPYISFADTDFTFSLWLAYIPFINAILTPRSFKRDLGSKHVRLDSYKELSYLHPNHFKPDHEVMKMMGLKRDEKFVLIRFVAFEAYHDVGVSGFTIESKERLVRELSKHAKVFITSESALPTHLQKYQLDIPVEMLHSVIHYASLYVGDSQTTATEAACLATPVIRCNAFAHTDKERSNFNELEKKYSLMYNFNVKEQHKAIEKAVELIQNEEIKNEWMKRRDAMLCDKIDLTQFMIWFTENYPDSKEKMKQNPNFSQQFK